MLGQVITSPPVPLSLKGEGGPKECAVRTWDPTRRITKGQPVEQAKKELARQYRKDPTPAERAVWELLRGRRLLGLKFRRQQLILGFIVDFFCAQHRLVLEIDGSSHEPLARQAQDEERSRILARLELRVIRVRNEEVDAARLQELIRKELNLQSPPLT